MSQTEPTINPGEDRPIIVGGGPQMITVQIPDSAAGKPRTFSVAPKDPAVPFKEIIITEGASEVFRVTLQEEWKITIV